MAINYTKLAGTALRLVKANGRAVMFIRLNDTPADSDEPWKAAATPRNPAEIETPTFALAVPPSGVSKLGFKIESDDFVKRSEQILIVAPASVDLDNYTEVVDGAIRWQVTGMEKLKPATTTLLYFVGVKR